jgi:hypothetical protein
MSVDTVLENPPGYRVMGTRRCACGCGTSFTVTTRHRLKLFLNKTHANRGRAPMAEQEPGPSIPAHLEQQFAALIAMQLDDDQRLTRAQLMRLCYMSYQLKDEGQMEQAA